MHFIVFIYICYCIIKYASFACHDNMFVIFVNVCYLLHWDNTVHQISFMFVYFGVMIF